MQSKKLNKFVDGFYFILFLLNRQNSTNYSVAEWKKYKIMRDDNIDWQGPPRTTFMISAAIYWSMNLKSSKCGTS